MSTDTLPDTLAELQRLIDQVADRLAIIVDAVDRLPDPDPLAPYRLANGAVCYVTTYADVLSPGDWVQACHGDTAWHEVVDAEHFIGDDGRPWVRVLLDGRAIYWHATNALRIARPPADVLDAQGADQ